MNRDQLFLCLAREIASDLYPLETILKNYQIDQNQWQTISTNPQFVKLLEASVREWHAVGSSSERVKYKMLMMLEHSLPAMFTQLHSEREPLSAKARVFELLMTGSDIGGAKNQLGGGAEGIKITINLGSDTQVKVDTTIPKQVTTIEGEAEEIDDFFAGAIEYSNDEVVE